MKRQNQIGLIILAAGASSRLGTAKQLVRFNGETLLRRIARESLASICRPAVVVLGAEIVESKKELNGLDVRTVENPDWQQGMGSSIKTGLRELLKIEKNVGGAVLTVCDQPFVTGAIIDRLVGLYRKNKALIVASAYRQTLGVPALFDSELFPRLSELESGGAKQIINQFKARTVSFPFAAGAIDIDTPEDLRKMDCGF